MRLVDNISPSDELILEEWKKIDSQTEKAVSKLKEDDFIPDLVVGISRAGAIIGRIISSKLKTDFKIDYRKARKRYQGQIVLDKHHSKVLIVDYICSSSGTFLDAREDLLCDTYPKDLLDDIDDKKINVRVWLNRIMTYENIGNVDSLIKERFGRDIRFLSIFYDASGSLSDINIHYYCESNTQKLPKVIWKYSDENNLRVLLNTKFEWNQEVHDLINEINVCITSSFKEPSLMEELSLIGNEFLEEIDMTYEIHLSDSDTYLRNEIFEKDLGETKNKETRFELMNGAYGAKIITSRIENIQLYSLYTLSKKDNSRSTLNLVFSDQSRYITRGDVGVCGECNLRESEEQKKGLTNVTFVFTIAIHSCL